MEGQMNRVRKFIFPGAIFSSIIIASFGYSVMARVPIGAATNTSSQTVTLNTEIAISNDGENIEEQAPSPANKNGDDGECRVNPDYPENIRQWCTQIMRHSEKNDLDPNLVAALIWQESGGNPTAYSKSGAVGLMQVMPHDGIATSFQCINGPCFANRPSISELQKPNFNIKYGTAMLAGLLNKYGNMRAALKYYGPMNVGYYYADKVLGIFNSYSG
jgi:soluble lytic murein transglycosylase-like protein